jgi:hypothetical protein
VEKERKVRSIDVTLIRLLIEAFSPGIVFKVVVHYGTT